jgi:predicted GNAT family N-acyltransferase
MKNLTIEEIPISMVLPIRQKVMWPDKDLEFVKVPEDESGLHLGLKSEGQLISVISVFSDNEVAQFRKFATLDQFQGQGYGSILLNYVFDFLKNKKISKIKCNARKDKVAFYRKFGMKETYKSFEKAGISFVVMEISLEEEVK